MVNFYLRFITGLSSKQAPKNNVLALNIKKNYTIIWTTKASAAFEAIKEKLVTLLAHLRDDAHWVVRSDASDTAVGAMLQQLIDHKWQPLGFFSKKLSPTETRYGAYDRKLLAVYLSIEHFTFAFQ